MTIELFRADPSRLNRLFTHQVARRQFHLLHCYPFIRGAGILAQIFPHILIWMWAWFRITSAHRRHSNPPGDENHALHQDPLPSDSYGLGEHFAVSAATWRTGFAA